METYSIVRSYSDSKPARVIKMGLTLEEAQEHCQRDDTRNPGLWFDGYQSENTTNSRRSKMATKLRIKNKKGVITEWVHGGSAKTGNGSMLTDGGLLWSYGLQIGFTSQGGLRVVGDFTSGGGEYHSQTTSTHVGAAKREAHEVVHPEVFKTMVPELFTQDR